MTETREPVDAGRDRSRPHVWPCRHCDMVDDYRLNRENEIQLAEGRFRQDEDYRLTTFKRWLQTFEWDSTRERYQHDTAARDADGAAETGGDTADHGWRAEADPWAAHWSARWAGSADDAAATVPAPRTGDQLADDFSDEFADDVADAAGRAEQLRRWHAADTAASADTTTEADDVADDATVLVADPTRSV